MSTLSDQALRKKIELNRTLRSVLLQYIPWLNGSSLVDLSQAIAGLEAEIDAAIDDPRLRSNNVVDPRLDDILQRLRALNPCPLGNECSKPCDHAPVCQEVSNA